jgi:hypothetical protein
MNVGNSITVQVLAIQMQEIRVQKLKEHQYFFLARRRGKTLMTFREAL